MADRNDDAAGAVIVAAGVCAALHVGKLPPAVAALQQSLGLTLVEAGFMLSLVQGAGMLLGLVLGSLADAFGGRRSVLLGSSVLALASAAGSAAASVPALLACRAVEGLGFLLVVLPAPGLIRRLVAPERLARWLGGWGAYMPLGTALGLLAGPWVIAHFGWRAWWWALAVLSAVAALAVSRRVPADSRRPVAGAGAAGLAARVQFTLAAPAAWLLALAFAAYSGQWIAVIGFLPTVYGQAGVAPGSAGALTALVAAANMLGNIGAGRLLQRGAPAPRLLATGFAVMGVGGAVAFAAGPPALRYAAVLLFSGVGGLIPGTLFALASRLVPRADAMAGTVGFMQQCSALGQFAGPPLVAWVASRAGSWQYTGAVTGGCALVGLALVRRLARRLARRGA